MLRAEQSIRNVGTRLNSGLSPELRRVFLTYPHTDTHERAVDTTEIRVEEGNAVRFSNNAGCYLVKIRHLFNIFLLKCIKVLNKQRKNIK